MLDSGVEDNPEVPAFIGLLDAHQVKSDGLDGDPLGVALYIEGFSMTDGLQADLLPVYLKVEGGEDHQVYLVEVDELVEKVEGVIALKRAIAA
jgi:hypothetical protein